MSMSPEDFAFFRKFLHEKSGLDLSDKKTYLVVSRLTPVAKKWNLNTITDMTKALKMNPDPKLVLEVVDAMTTNETLFFRDDRPFKYFKASALPELMKARENKKNVRIWSTACSTGQEPYSIAMTLTDSIPKIDEWKFDILATDISDTALKQAASGEFNQFEIQRGLPIQMVMKHFRQEGPVWKVQDKIKNMVKFQHFNLLDRMEPLGTFDIIFCRNVLIYFDETTKKKILQNLAARLVPDGMLFLGGSETVIGLCPALRSNPACAGLHSLNTDIPASQTSIPEKKAPIIPVTTATKIR